MDSPQQEIVFYTAKLEAAIGSAADAASPLNAGMTTEQWAQRNRAVSQATQMLLDAMNLILKELGC